jgi:hypothetical protein
MAIEATAGVSSTTVETTECGIRRTAVNTAISSFRKLPVFPIIEFYTPNLATKRDARPDVTASIRLNSRH